MDRLVKWLLIGLVAFFAGRWGVERFMEFVDARYEEREVMARQVGEMKAAEIQRTIEAGQARRAEEMRRQLDAAGALQSGSGPAPINPQPLRRQLDDAARQQSSRYDSVVPR